jgi:hypothetical protein
MTDLATGRCLCGAVAFRVTQGPLRPVALCHCGMCRRWHGHVGAYTAAEKSALVFTEQRGLAWHQSSADARRGFCRECGSSLFWEGANRKTISITAGSLDAPTGLTTVTQIYADHKGDYYPIDPSVPAHTHPG